MQTLLQGLGYRHVDGDFVDNFQATIPDHHQDLYGVFLQDRIKRSLMWLTVASKYGHNGFELVPPPTGIERVVYAKATWSY